MNYAIRYQCIKLKIVSSELFVPKAYFLHFVLRRIDFLMLAENFVVDEKKALRDFMPSELQIRL